MKHLKKNKKNESIPLVTNAEYLGEYKVKLAFNDGAKGLVNLENFILNAKPNGMFKPLQDLKNFATVKYDKDARTITWFNEADLAPEYLREILQPLDS
jgi:hypothetical protein